MKTINTRLATTILFFILGFSGCQHESPVELVDENDDAQLIEMNAVGMGSDSLYLISGVDSTGLVGPENSKYYGKMVFTAIRYDMALRSDSLVRAEVIFMDKAHPIQAGGRILAYPTFDVGTVLLNIDTLNKYQWSKRIFQNDSVLGYRYQIRKSYAYSAGEQYRWQLTGHDQIDSNSVVFETPSELRVTGITPEYVHPAEQMRIRWNCTNPTVNIVISREGGQQQKTWVPVVQLKVKNTKGEITIPTKVLEILPTKTNQRFLFTFSSEAKFSTVIAGYPDPVLIQSASIHNVLLNVRQ